MRLSSRSGSGSAPPGATTSSDEDSAAIVRSIVALGRGLKMRTVAEGVETERQLAMLRELGCDEFQGYLFARPLDPAAVPALLQAVNLAGRDCP